MISDACHDLLRPVVQSRLSLSGEIRIPGTRIENAGEVPVIGQFVYCHGEHRKDCGRCKERTEFQIQNGIIIRSKGLPGLQGFKHEGN